MILKKLIVALTVSLIAYLIGFQEFAYGVLVGTILSIVFGAITKKK